MQFASLKPHFSRALAAGAPRLHLAAHSHHLWPDATYVAHNRAWEDAAARWDDKWGHVFDSEIPKAQRHIARHLNLPDPASIAFAPNTHEFVLRLFSALPAHRPPRVLTTDSEFHSFARQAARLAEEDLIQLHTVPAAPSETFAARFAAAAAAGEHDLVFFSQVFFNSGVANTDLAALVAAVRNPETLVVIDGYHGFMARPTDLAPVAQRAFYLAGGYKYAMAGEGACFLHCPPGYAARPRNTGWYAAFGALAEKTQGVPYAPTGARFMGATFDPTALYRLNAAMDWLAAQAITPSEIHARALNLQAALLRVLPPPLTTAALLAPNQAARGNFLALKADAAPAWQRALHAAGVVTDLRATTLRLGFGLYHDEADIPFIVDRLATALAGAA